MTLEDYNQKRKFAQTPEPPGEVQAGQGPLRFVVQMHEASRLHYDFRIEAGGVLKSWAVPKGPSLRVQDQRLAVQVEDHPITYGSFEGIIPKGNYGAGTVMVWDEGEYSERHSSSSSSRQETESLVLKGIEQGHLTMILYGEKLQGEFALIRLKEGDPKSWLLVKKRDSYASFADITLENRSVKTGRSIEEIAAQAPAEGNVWLPGRQPTENSGRLRKDRNSQESRKDIPPPSVLPGLSRLSPSSEKIPRRIKPMLATVFSFPFDQVGWIFEFDRKGYRAIAELEKGVVHLYSKQHLPFEKKFPEIVKSLGQLHITAVLDGEIAGTPGQAPVYWVKDLLHLEGTNTRVLPLVERKRLLEQLKFDSIFVRYCPHEVERGTFLYGQIEKENATGIVAKDGASVYHSGTSKKWLQISAQEHSDENRPPRLTHLDKIYWPEEKITKGDLIDYYKKVSPYLLPHLCGRPESLHRFPDGVNAPGFFQKDLVGYHPRWVQTERIFSESAGKSVDYLVCQNEWTLLYMVNLGCIEINPWLSRVGSLDRPDAIVIDLDPDENPFSEVIEVAQAIHEILKEISVTHYCKTSGGTGLHIFIPTWIPGPTTPPQVLCDYDSGREFALAVCRVVHSLFPRNTSLERVPSKRKGKIYLDCFQNSKGQTVASVYSVRPRPRAPVSTPLLWEELKSGLHPELFTISQVPGRIERLGDLWRPVLEESNDIRTGLSSLVEKYPMSQ